MTNNGIAHTNLATAATEGALESVQDVIDKTPYFELPGLYLPVDDVIVP